MRIKNIVIIGGGTAGWATAHQFLNKTSPETKITVIASKEIPIVGVGESTTGRFNDLINLKQNHTGLNERNFLVETSSTFKIGIKHSDWRKKGESFYSPIGDSYSHNISGYPHTDYDCLRIYHIANNIPFTQTFQSRLMEENRLHFINGQDIFEIDDGHRNGKPVAYHLDTYKVGQYLKRQALTVKKCKYIDDQVVSFKQDEKGFVTSVKTKKGKTVKGDLWIDCSGFRKVLINKAFKNEWKTYKNNLLVNRALNFNVKYKPGEEIRGYTHAKALSNGWLWEIPTQERLGCGYVFSDNHITKEKAKEEVEKVLGHEIEVQRDIPFETGRQEKFWIKNVLSTGLSSAFIEPLEATSIHATILQVTHFIENYYKQDLPVECELFHNQYNFSMTTMWDNIMDFIVFHYLTPRKDSEFWIESAKKERMTPRLQGLMEMWKYKMPRVVDYINDKENNFYSIGNVLWYQIGIGMKYFNSKVAKKELQDYGEYIRAENAFKEIVRLVNLEMPKFIKSNDYYKNL